MMHLGRFSVFLICLALMGPAAVSAEAFDPEYSHYEHATYPQDLSTGDVSGSVRITYRIESDGSLSDVAVEHSTHPAFSKSVLLAVSRWQYMPWTPSERLPESISQTTNVFFGANTQRSGWKEITKNQLTQMSCKSFVRGLSGKRRSQSANELFATRALDEIRRLIQFAVIENRVSYYEGLTLSGEFDEASPALFDRCAGQPDLKFVDVLPARVRNVI